jgi:hypothetical protein
MHDTLEKQSVMTDERALEIVRAINQRCYETMGVNDKPLASLDDVSLQNMLTARDLVEAINSRTEQEQKENGGSRTIHMVPDPRLIAAVYCIAHYPEDGKEPILCLPAQNFLRERGVTYLVRAGSYGEEYERMIQEDDDD